LPIPFDALDLNLLRVFDALYEERNVTRAAARIGIGQPAMSGALARLREAFDDPLFIRSAGGMVPTPAARRLSAAVAEAMARMRGVVEPRQTFDAARSDRVFRIATTDYAEAVLFSAVMGRLHGAAPGVSLRLTRMRELFVVPGDALETGALDLAVGFFSEVRPRGSSILTRKLFSDPLVCVTRQKHPRIRTRLTLAAFLEIAQIRVLYPEEEESGIIDTLLAARGKRRNVALTLPHHLSIPPVVAASDLLGIVPQRLAHNARGKHALRAFAPPLPLPDLVVSMAWHERRQHDPAHAWLRETIAGAAATV
jgi:DNA-binding transcriptional LysR family regulator